MSSRVAFVAVLSGLVVNTSARAQEAVDESAGAPEASALTEQVFAEPPAPPSSPFTLDVGPLPIEFHGYASQAYVYSSHNHYFNVESDGGSFHLTEVALNVQSQVTDRTRIVLQVAGLMNDTTASPFITLDFGFVDHRFSDAFGVRLGRFRQLQNLYSEVWDTDIARLPIFLPTSVYDPQGRQYFMNAQGVQVYGALRSRHAGAVDYAASVGALSPFTLGGGGDDDVDLVASGRLIYSPPIEGLRVGGAALYADGNLGNDIGPLAAGNLITAGQVPPTFDGTVSSTIHYAQLTAFAEYTNGNWTLAGEYARSHLRISPDDQALAFLNPERRGYGEGFYLLTSYRFTDHFTAGGYASFYFDDYRHRGSSDPALHSFDYAATFRFDLNSYLAFKAEVHRIYGTAKLDPRLNGDGLDGDKDWLFAFRASAAF